MICGSRVLVMEGASPVLEAGNYRARRNASIWNFVRIWMREPDIWRDRCSRLGSIFATTEEVRCLEVVDRSFLRWTWFT